MILKKALEIGRQKLTGIRDIENPQLESEVFLRHILKLNRAQLLLRLNVELTPEHELNFSQWIERRMSGEPLAYIINSREFFGLDFFVDSRVLIPRPETELLVEEVIRHYDGNSEVVLADVGTGSGAIAVSLAVNLPRVKIYAIDISARALEVAKSNLQRYKLEDHVTLLHGDLLNPLIQPVDAVIANLPYVRTADWLAMPSASFEPRQALDGGEKGLDCIFQLAGQLKSKLKPGGLSLLEIGMGQTEEILDYIRKLDLFKSIEIVKDLAGIERVIKLWL